MRFMYVLRGERWQRYRKLFEVVCDRLAGPPQQRS